MDAAVTARDSHIAGLEQHSAALHQHNQSLEAQGLIQARAIASHEADVTSLSGMVIERERTIRDLTERLEEANACHDRSIASLESVSARLEELQAQARGQATRIRMKALREAVELSSKAQAVAEADEADAPAPEVVEAAEEPTPVDVAADVAAVEEAAAEAAPQPTANGSTNGNGHDTSWEPGLYEGKIRLEIGPLGDFSQLVGVEDAVGRLGATDVSVERFSEGRATFSMRLEQPVDLLRELETLAALDFKVRHTAPDNLVLDLEDEGPGSPSPSGAAPSKDFHFRH
ncbi:MAG: hypothetical protein BGO11_06910 [Solirubrobacterales bacterium 70-9]|nr:MAG: hypothetical protein BGO11_06910 [Solirubrobacterales bacterium 70-9]